MVMAARPLIYAVRWVYKLMTAIWQRIAEPATTHFSRAQERLRDTGLSVYALYEQLFLMALRVQLNPQEPVFSCASIARRLRASLFSAIFFTLTLMVVILPILGQMRILQRLYSLLSALVRRVIFWTLLPFLTLLRVLSILREAAIVLKTACVGKLESAKVSFDSCVSSLTAVATRPAIWIPLQQRSCSLRDGLLRTFYTLMSLFREFVYDMKCRFAMFLLALLLLGYCIYLYVTSREERPVVILKSPRCLFEEFSSYTKRNTEIYVIWLAILTKRALKNLTDLKTRSTTYLVNLESRLVEFVHGAISR